MRTTALALSILMALGLMSSAAHATTEESMNKAGCMACHAKDKKVLGPAFKDIAAKYKGQDVTAKLMDKARKGGSGVWGPIPMPANTVEKISDADLKAAIELILKS
jgi:cytochrome c